MTLSVRTSLLRAAFGAGITSMMMAFGPSSLMGQRDLRDMPDPDPELERIALEVADGFEVNLYAADPLLAKPIQINFDEKGRLWVASSEVYPQIKPGQFANDKILVLDDVDGDGTADMTTVFADGLLIPTGVLPGHGGCYVANSTELLHMMDTNGDGRADRRRVVLSGFGTEDTHHILHTLRWGPEGAMYMNQSIYIHSHIETPYGVRRMNGSGVWRFRTDTLELEAFTLGLVNPWGHAWSRYGVSFQTDGAGGEGIVYTFPGFVGVTSPGAARVLGGLNPGKPKLCGLEVVGGSHLPDEWRDNLITNDFRAHRVCRYVVTEQGSGFVADELDELIKTAHVAFRPVDVKMGPDGAIYIADWYNPIIQHGEVDFRDPRRDHVHGRIWRVTAKNRALIPRLDLKQLDTTELVRLLNSPEPWRRRQARWVLRDRPPGDVKPLLRQWLAQLDPLAPDTESSQLEAMWTFQAMNDCPADLIRQLLEADQPQVRAAATRALHDWHDRLPDALALLAARVSDPHARVRLEAVCCLGRIRQPRACEIAMRALDRPVDRFLEFSLWRTARDLEAIWVPALKRGEIDFGGNTEHLTFALQSVASKDIVPELIALLDDTSLDPELTQTVLAIVTIVGDGERMRLVLDHALSTESTDDHRDRLLELLIQATQERGVVPDGDLNAIATLLDSPNPRTVRLALQASGVWNLGDVARDVVKIAGAEDRSESERVTAVDALAKMSAPSAHAFLRKLATSASSPQVRLHAASGMLRNALDQGSDTMAATLETMESHVDPSAAIHAALSRKGAAERLATALSSRSLERDVALRAVRTVQSSGRSEPALIAALSEAGGLSTTPWDSSSRGFTDLIDEAMSQGDPVLGEAVYRRMDLACQKCHAIGGAGGRVGPDLASIGASAQPDYILESLVRPNAKIKENYHTQIVETDEGRIQTGVFIRETETDLILRNAEDQEIRVPLGTIAQRTDGGSLMPQGVLNSLTRDELGHLVRFLSELGKVGGEFELPREPYVRNWLTMENNKTNLGTVHGMGIARAATHPQDFTWAQAFSRVGGDLPLDELPAIRLGPHQTVMVLRSTLKSDVSREVHLRVNRSQGVTVWLDGKKLADRRVSMGDEVGRARELTLVVDVANDSQTALQLVVEPIR